MICVYLFFFFEFRSYNWLDIIIVNLKEVIKIEENENKIVLNKNCYFNC